MVLLVYYLVPDQVKTLRDPKLEWYRVQYLCPHSNKGHRVRKTKGERRNQNIMGCDCPVEISFSFDKDLEKFKISKSVLEHKNHVIS